jgi:Planctomycete cytochrome C
MSTSHRPSGLTRLVILIAVGLVPIGLSCTSALCLGQDYGGGQDPGGLEMPFLGPFPGDFDSATRRGLRTKTAKKSLLAKKADTSGKAKTAATKKDSAGSTQIKFSEDIAPILVANCVGCHSGDKAGARRGKLDLTTFEKLQKGGKSDDKITVPGKPAKSELVMRIKGEKQPRMPQGNNGVLSPDAIAKIEQWVKEGAKLDGGIDPKKTIASYAASVDQLRRNQLAKIPPQERDKIVEAAGLERWRKSGAKVKPEIARGEHFIMFSNLSSERASSTLKVLDRQPSRLKTYVGLPRTDRVEKVSVFVFSNRKDFIEFVRSVEKNEIEADTLSSAQLTVDQPYLAVVDPTGSKKDEAGASKRKARSRRSDEKDMDGPSAERSLAGILTETFGAATVESAGKPPRWLVLGVGSLFAAQVEPKSHYYQQLRQTAFANFSQGWDNRANNALGQTDQITADGIHAIGFALVEAMLSEMRQGFPAFVQGLIQEGNKLDETLQQVYGGSRQDFLDGTGEWVAAHYGHLE